MSSSSLNDSECADRAGGHDHAVKFYDTDECLAATVRDFIVPAARTGDAAIIVATAAHHCDFESALDAAGVDVAALVGTERYLALDARETLARFMDGGTPDAASFARTVGPLIERAGRAGRRVRIYGEMVALLWDDGEVAAAIALEELWNDLAATHDFILLCAYPMHAFDDAQSAHAYRRICDAHATVIPRRSQTPPPGGGAGAGAGAHERQITQLRHEQAERRSAECDDAVWVARIGQAFDEDRFELYSQPIVPLAGGVAHEELLLRMITRDGYVISPGAFLPTAERFGLIAQIDRWMISQAVRYVAVGRIVHVNLSATSVLDPCLLSFIAAQLESVAAPPANMVFEVAESALMSRRAAGEAFAVGLRELGCGLVLDDISTGFGSLKRLPVQSLRIDIDFVRDLSTNEASRHLVRAIVDVAHRFGADTIACGVEDHRALQLLREYGVDYAQGHLLSHPAPQRDAPRLLRHDPRKPSIGDRARLHRGQLLHDIAHHG